MSDVRGGWRWLEVGGYWSVGRAVLEGVRVTSDTTEVEDSASALMLRPHCRDQLSSDFWGGTNRVREEQRREVVLDSRSITSWVVTTRKSELYTESSELSEICLSNNKKYKTIKQ